MMEQSWYDTLCPLLWEETSDTHENVGIGAYRGIDLEEKLVGICQESSSNFTPVSYALQMQCWAEDPAAVNLFGSVEL